MTLSIFFSCSKFALYLLKSVSSCPLTFLNNCLFCLWVSCDPYTFWIIFFFSYIVCKCFLLLHKLLLHFSLFFFRVSSAVQKILSMRSSNLSTFMAPCSHSPSKRLLPDPMPCNVSFMHSTSNLKVSGCRLRVDPLWFDFCIECKKEVLFHT